MSNEKAREFENQWYASREFDSDDVPAMMQAFSDQENATLKERVRELEKLRDEVLTVWNEDGEGGEIQMKTPIAWHRVLRIAEQLLTNDSDE